MNYTAAAENLRPLKELARGYTAHFCSSPAYHWYQGIKVQKLSTRKLLLLVLVLTFAGCDYERNIETRPKIAIGKAKTSYYEELSDFGEYSKYRDTEFRQRFMTRVEENRKTRKIERQTAEAVRDGSLAEKYDKNKGRRASRNRGNISGTNG